MKAAFKIYYSSIICLNNTTHNICIIKSFHDSSNIFHVESFSQKVSSYIKLPNAPNTKKWNGCEQCNMNNESHPSKICHRISLSDFHLAYCAYVKWIAFSFRFFILNTLASFYYCRFKGTNLYRVFAQATVYLDVVHSLEFVNPSTSNGAAQQRDADLKRQSNGKNCEFHFHFNWIVIHSRWFTRLLGLLFQNWIALCFHLTELSIAFGQRGPGWFGCCFQNVVEVESSDWWRNCLVFIFMEYVKG